MRSPLRSYSVLDQLCLQAEQGLRLWAGVQHPMHSRQNPAENHPQAPLTPVQCEAIAALMRVNHTGEICAQALYFGQALLARTPELRTHLYQAALEEGDHLRWCESRVHELGGQTSVFNPVFYTLSGLIGILAACFGDKISLGFVAETELQVEQHLQTHLDQLPLEDERSRAILLQMQADEVAHGSEALAAGGEILPAIIRTTMRGIAKIMTGIAKWA